MDATSNTTISISIDTINISINGAPAKRHTLEDAIAAIFGGADVRVTPVPDPEDQDVGTTAAAEPTENASAVAPVATAVAATADVDADRIKLHLENDTRWAYRSADGIASDLEVDEGLVAQALDALVAKGVLRRKARREDGVKVYALVPAAGTVTVTVDDLVAYLTSHSRFQKRTKNAIVRNFAGADAAQLDRAIEEAKRVGKVKQYRRRRDSAQLFGVINSRY